MERGHVGPLLVAALAGIVTASASAGAVRFSVAGRGVGGPSARFASLAVNRATAGPFRRWLEADDSSVLARLDFRSWLAVFVSDRFGCRDHRARVASVSRAAKLLRVRMVVDPPSPGTVECQAFFQTYRLLVLPKAQFGPATPSRAELGDARA